MERRLAAVLAADVVGYSRLMGQDEAGTLAALRAVRDNHVAPLVKQHRGRVVKLMGDGFLVEFASAVDAVACAIAWQQDPAAPAAAQPLTFRIGINLGEIVIEAGDIFGDGVNIAARLEGIADPGGIAISDLVHQTLAGKMDRDFDDQGLRSLKNIDRQIRVWRWTGVALASKSDTNPAVAAVTKTALAVQPFTCASRNSEHQDFAEGLGRDLLVELGKFSAFSVVTSWSAKAADGASSAEERGRTLGIDYLLDGSVQASSNRIRVSVQVTELAKGEQIWAHRFDGSPEDLFDFQDEVTQSICGLLYIPLITHATARARKKPEHGSGAYDYYLTAFHLIERPTEAGMRDAKAACRKVLEIDPGFAMVYEPLSWINIHSALNAWTADPQDALREARRDALRGVALDEREGYLRAALGLSETLLGRTESGIEESRRAVRLNPNDVEYVTFLGACLAFVGETEEALERFAEAERLSPGYPPTDLFRGLACFAAGDAATAIPALESLLKVLPEYNLALLCLAASQAVTGQGAAAEESLATLRQQGPQMTAHYIRALLGGCYPELAETLLSALADMALPEGVAAS